MKELTTLRAIVFDIGQTLVEYKKPLSWSELYRPAFERISEKCCYTISESHYQLAYQILTKYNTRVNPRDYEVSSEQIFNEILSAMDIPMKDTLCRWLKTSIRKNAS